MLADRDAVSDPFAGELFLTLAMEGRLVIDAVRADAAIADLQRTLSAVQNRLHVLRVRQGRPTWRMDDLPDDLASDVVNAIFADQLSPGRLEQAEVELRKYIEAVRCARRPSPPPGAAASNTPEPQ